MKPNNKLKEYVLREHYDELFKENIKLKQAKQEMLKDEIDWIENLDKGMWNEDDFEERLKELKSSLKENEKE